MNKNLNNNWIRKKAAKHTKEDLITYKIGRARQENNDWKQIEKLQRYIRNFEQKNRKTIDCNADTTWKTFRDTNMTRNDNVGSQQYTTSIK